MMLYSNAQAREAEFRAQAASRAKSEFVACMSHELRTPMNGVLGIAKLLSDMDISPSAQNYVDMINQSAISLLTVVDDVLDFSKVEAGQLTTETLAFNLHDCLAGAMKMLAIRAAAKNVDFRCHIHPEVPQHLLGDAARIRQVIVNLAGNAIKFTKQGHVGLTVKLLNPGSDQTELQFTVEDTGIGIPADQLATIFQAFKQADSSTTRNYGGTGLGLAISSSLVELMGGRIWVDSTPGVGSSFHFALPLLVDGSATEDAEPFPAKLTSGRALVVDADAERAESYTKMLAGWGIQAVHAASAAQAHAELTSGAGYRMIFIEATLPTIDGYALASRIAAQPSPAPAPMVVMITPPDQPASAAACEQLQINATVTRPVLPHEMRRAILSTIESAPQSDDAKSSQNSNRQLKVLLAEDGIVNQQVAIGLLKLGGHSVVVAEDGIQAVAAYAQEPFDLVLMDLHMPGMDGLEATAAIRRHEATTGRRTPIIAMTAAALVEDRGRCLEAGMDNYLSKPVDIDQFNNMLRNYTPESDQPAADQPAVAAEETPGNAAAAEDTLPAIDLESALRNVGGCKEILCEVAAVFSQECPERLEQIRTSAAAGDCRGVARAAHTLKSSFMLFGAAGAAESARQLETMGREDHLNSFDDVYPRLVAEVETIEHAIRQMCDE